MLHDGFSWHFGLGHGFGLLLWIVVIALIVAAVVAIINKK